MFTEDEGKEFNTDFCKIGLTDEAEQKKILEFLYMFGTIAYDNINTLSIIGDGEEEENKQEGRGIC